jgi:hypothetical protein
VKARSRGTKRNWLFNGDVFSQHRGKFLQLHVTIDDEASIRRGPTLTYVRRRKSEGVFEIRRVLQQQGHGRRKRRSRISERRWGSCAPMAHRAQKDELAPLDQSIAGPLAPCTDGYLELGFDRRGDPPKKDASRNYPGVAKRPGASFPSALARERL